MKKKLAGGLAALSLFTVGTLVLVGYVRDAEDRALADEASVDVLVVNHPVGVGQDPAASLRVEQVPRRLLMADAVVPGDSLASMVARADLVPGEQLVWSRLGAPEAPSASDAGPLDIPEGLLAVTVPLSPQRAVGGLVAPGMSVAVVGSFELTIDDAGAASRNVQATHILVHRALVVRVQATAASLPVESEDTAATTTIAPVGNFLVTLAVPAYDVERIVFASEWGSIWLADENQAADGRGTQIQTPNSIFEQIRTDATSGARAPDISIATRSLPDRPAVSAPDETAPSTTATSANATPTTDPGETP